MRRFVYWFLREAQELSADEVDRDANYSSGNGADYGATGEEADTGAETGTCSAEEASVVVDKNEKAPEGFSGYDYRFGHAY